MLEEEGLLRPQEVVDLTYLQVEEVEVAVHLYLEEVEEGFPYQQRENTLLDLSLLRPSRKVSPARKS